jgi:hypothetical protein
VYVLEKFHSSGLIGNVEYFVNRVVNDVLAQYYNNEQRHHQHDCLKRVRHDNSLHTTLKDT